MRVLIVEDEPFAQQELKRLLLATGQDIEIVATTDSVEDTVDWLETRAAPDLIFLDIQLSDGLSFEIFKKVKVLCPVIFTTAFDEYSIQAFKVNSIDYLLKPIKVDELVAALDKLDEVRKSYTANAPLSFDVSRLEQLLKPLAKTYKSRFIAKTGEQIRHIQIEETAWFYAEDNVVFLMTKKNQRYIIDYTLDQLVAVLNPDQFVRLNRSHIAHIQSIGKVNRYFNGRLHVELLPAANEPVYVSRARAQEFVKWLDK